MAHDTYHESELLSGDARDIHRVIVGLMEELEAIDRYQQRSDPCAGPPVRDALPIGRAQPRN